MEPTYKDMKKFFEVASDYASRGHEVQIEVLPPGPYSQTQLLVYCTFPENELNGTWTFRPNGVAVKQT